MKFENAEISGALSIKRDGIMKLQECPYKEEAICSNHCPHFGTPEELILTKRTFVDLGPVYTDDPSGLYTLKICHGTVIKLGRIIL